MNTEEFTKLKETVSKGNGLLARIKKCKENVVLYTRFYDAAVELSNRQEWAKKKLNYWLTQLDKANKEFKDLK